MSNIVSVTIAHNRESTIAGALACVEPYVDACLILDTGITDRTLDIARDTVGSKLEVHSEPWRDDFSFARNAALDRAADLGAEWAVLIDTDQRIDWNGTDPREVLRDSSAPVWTMRSRNGRFAKEQILRIPRQGSYRGRTHECFPHVNAPEVPRARVWEIAKTPEELRAKFERDLLLLQADVKEDPLRARTWFYLGETYANLDRKEDAIESHTQSFYRSTSLDESTWSAYRVAQLLCAREEYENALLWCGRGLGRAPLRLELSALAAWICHRQGEYGGCLTWATEALAWGKVLDRPGRGGRRPSGSFFCDLEAYYDGPAGLAALASGALGQIASSQTYEEERIRLRDRRLAENA